MVQIKSPRARSTQEEKMAAIQRAVKVLRGTRALTKNAIAIRASAYIPEAQTVVLRILNKMSKEEFSALVAEKRSM